MGWEPIYAVTLRKTHRQIAPHAEGTRFQWRIPASEVASLADTHKPGSDVDRASISDNWESRNPVITQCFIGRNRDRAPGHIA